MRILMLTSVYRDETGEIQDKDPNIVNLFVKEWQQQQHDVIVIHNAHEYPGFAYRLPHYVKMRIETTVRCDIRPYELVKKKRFEDGGVIVWRLPMKKYIPHRPHSQKTVKKQIERICEALQAESFIPDIIIGHWASPQMELISELKDIYSCRTAIVLHGTGYISDGKYPAQKYLKKIDCIGCRSEKTSQKIQTILGLPVKPFVCYSGVPDSFLEKVSMNVGKYEKIEQWKFVYAGRIVKYKNIDVYIKALARLVDINWTLDIIGDGPELNNLKKLADSLHCSEAIRFHGRISREEVISIMAEAHCFVTVSANEIFGLVYLEAMAASCITVGSKDEGIDGVIVDGENGFLSKAGDEDELYLILSKITTMTRNELIQYASKGYQTACEFADSKVAMRYLEDVMIEKSSIR